MKVYSIEEALRKNGKCVFPIKGVSMLPMLEQEKDAVLIVPVEGRLKKYDIPLYKVGETYVLHRIIDVRNDHYIICGDNCIQKEKVPFENVIGVVCGFYKNGMYVSCHDKKYVKYVKKRCGTRKIRVFVKRTRLFLGKVKYKIKKWICH